MSAFLFRKSSTRRFGRQSGIGNTLWKADDEGRPFPRLAFDVDRAAVLQDQMLRDREPESAAGDVLGAALVDAIEAPKNLRALRFGDSVSMIGDANDARLRLVDHCHVDLAVVTAVFDGVVEQIRKSLLQAQHVAADDGISLDSESDPMIRRLIGEIFTKIVQHPAQIDAAK